MESVLYLLFRPLARLAISKGWRFGDVSDCLRQAYVDAARESAGESGSVSRLSVMTGLQRRDVDRLLQSTRTETARPDPLARLVAQWLARFDGAPLARREGAASFDQLALSIRKDVHPRTMLDALVAAGTVAVHDDEVHLIKHAYVPLEGSEEQTRYLGQNVGDHLSVAVANVVGDQPGYDLAVHYDGLSDEAVEALQALWRARMGPVLQDLNDKAAVLQDESAGTLRFRAGGYFFKGSGE